MSNDVSSRVSKAKHELDKAYERLLKNAGLTKQIIEEFGKAKDVAKLYDVLTALTIAPLEEGDALKEGIRKINDSFKAVGIGLTFIQDGLKGNDKHSLGIGLLVDLGLDFGVEKVAASFNVHLSAAIGLFTTGINIGNLINKATGSPELDINKWLKEKLEELRGVTNDLPEIKNGMMYLTMHDGTIYARPLTENGMHFISGSDKNDVLFGDGNKDILVGHGGGDLLIGGAGADDYFVNNGDIIDDSDKRGRIFDSATQKQYTGGTFDKKSGYYIGENGWYKIEGNDLIINNKITVKGFNKDNNDLGITLLEANDIAISIRGKTVLSEQGNGKHSEGYKIELNRSLEKNEWMIVKVLNDSGEERYVFYGDVPKEYYDALFSKMVYSNNTYLSWDGNTTANEDINVAVGVSVYAHSDNIKVKTITPLEVTIKDDDRDPKEDLPETYDPIVIDFNKNGITSTKLDNTVYFDHDNNGFKEATAWIEKDDGLLALDKDGNGKIDNGSELFGNHTVSNTAYGYTDPKATNGYEALKTYDINNDNVIDEKDEIFSKLKIWKDKNSNGITDEGELSSLTHNNIKSIDLNYKEIAMDENSNMVKQSSKVTLNDDSTINANDVWFKVNLDKTKEEDINIPLEIRSLPKIKAFGNLNSLQVAASKNDTLAAMINLYLMLNPEDRKKHINDIVYEWAGVNDIDPNSRTTSIDSRMVNVYEKITGKPFTWHGGSNDANIRISANIIKERFDIFKHYVYATIELQTTYVDIDLDTETMSLENNGKPRYKFDALNSRLTQLYKDNRYDEIKNLMDVVREASAYKPMFQENLKSNLLSIFGSDYKLLSLCLNTYIQGTDDDNTINGSSENNLIVGGKGNDILYGGDGNDTYIFYKGDGNDTIYDAIGNDKIEFKEGIAPGNVSFKRELDKLIISIKSDSEADGGSITIQNFFSVNPAIGNNTVRTITFADGTTYNLNKILELTPLNSTDKDDKLYLTDDNDTFDAGPGNDEIWGGDGNDIINGNEGDDILYGNDGNDTLIGNDGNDTVYGGSGNDILEGGKGDDALQGDYDDDTYVYSKGDGNDTIYDYQGKNTIEFKDINKDGVEFFSNNAGLLIKIKETQDTISLNSQNSDFSFKFSDGTILKDKDISLTINGDDGNNILYGLKGNDAIVGNGGDDTIYGNDGDDVLKGGNGNDSIYSGYGNDILEGGKGNDVLQGDYGDDTYIYSKGDGNDTIYDYQGKNTIEFKDINKGEVEFSAKNNDLLITVKDTQEYITLKDIFWQNSDFNFKFADGNTIGIRDLVLTFTGDDGDNDLYGYIGNDVLEGGKGNDYLDGGNGNDVYVYNKGDGNDTIYDFRGNNTIEFKDLNKDEIIFTEDQGGLLVKIRNTNEQITIMNFFNSESSSMSFKFADGTTLDENGAKAAALIGDNNDNMIQGYDSNDILKGNGGNDTIYGGKGDDDIEGGIGNDILVGNTGVDTYVFGRGDGQDVIYALDADYGRSNIDDKGNYNIPYYYNQQNVKGTDIIKFKEGVTKNDLIFERAGANGHDLLIKIKDTDDSITVKDMFSDAVSLRGIDKIEFADGSFMDIEEIHKSTPIITNQYNQQQIYGSIYSDTIIGNDQNNTAYGKDGNDVIHGHEGEDKLYGDAGNDTLIGGKGNDYLDGGDGNDVYIYNKGDGNDTITDTSGTDTIKFGSGISKQDIIVKRTNVENAQDYRNITVSFKNSPNDSITILDVSTGNTTNDSNIIETFEFENGDRLSFEDIKKLSLIGTEGSENIIGYVHANNIIKGSGGDDTLYGQEGNDTIDGEEGNDIIEGGSGNDTLIGGAGNDTLNGGIGDNVYVYNKGDGNDTIVDTGGTDIIKFRQGINKEDLVATKSGDEHYKDITLTFKNSPSDSIVIKEVFMGENIKANNKIETLEFANGERLKIEDIKLNIIGSKENDDIRGYNDFSNIIKGNGGDDTLYGGNINDTIYGGDGNDRLYGGRGNDTLMGQDGDDELNGGDGNDVLEGGSGNDTLDGGDGEDTYAFARGDGQDTIVYSDGKDIIKFKDGIKADDLMFEISKSQDFSSKDNILIRIKDTSDSILLMNTFEYGNIVGGIDKIVFHDGSSINFNEIVKKTMIASSDNGVTINGLNTDDTIIGGKGDDILYGNKGNDAIYGGSGNDTLHGDAGDDILDGGAGDDRIEGGAGSDTYMFGRGSGKDIVENYDETPGRVDIIKIKNGLSRDDLLIKRVQINGFDGLLLEIKDTNDSMTVYNAFYEHDDHRRIDRIVFEDGSSVIELEEIIKTAFNDNVILGDAEGERYYVRGNDNLIDLTQGDDYINVGGKNVTYLFGRGDGQDTIFGADRASDKVDIIRFKEGIAKEDLIFQRSKPSWYENMFVIKIKDSKDSITVTGDFLFNDSEKGISKIEFSDGSFMDKEEIINIMLKGTDLDDIVYSDRDNDIAYGRGGNDVIRSSGKNSILYGGDGDDKLYAHGEDATLYGEAGNDELYADGSKIHTLVGGTGDDTYFCSLPSEENAVAIDNTGGGDDTLILKYTDSSKDAKFSKDGNDLLISGNYDNAGIIKIKNHFLGGDYAINKIVFGDFGGSINQEEINKLADIVYLSSQGGNNYLSDKDKKDNVYTYTGGKVTISDNGGDDRVVFKLDNPGDGLFYLSNGKDLKISTNKIDASNNDVLEIKNFFVNRSSIIENFDINDYWSVTAQSIYEQYGKTFPPETPGTPPSNPGGSDESSLTGGSEDNVFNYKGGMVSITDTGGNDKVIFTNPGSRVFYSSDGIDLMISTAKIDSSNNNILQVKNFFASKDSIIETFQINDRWSVTAQSIYKAFGKTYPNQTAPVNNNPTTPPNSDNLIGGKEDNVFTYTGGKKSITDTGGNDKVIFAKQGSKVFYSSDGVNLKISTAKINSSNKDVLEVKNFFSDKNAIIEEFQISDHWTVTAESIYQAFGKTYPTSTDTQNAPLALLGTPNNTSEAGLNDNNASDT